MVERLPAFRYQSEQPSENAKTIGIIKWSLIWFKLAGSKEIHIRTSLSEGV